MTTIRKTYGRKISLNYQTWIFETTIEAVVDVTTPKELSVESNKAFKAVKALTDRDIEATKKEIDKDVGKESDG